MKLYYRIIQTVILMIVATILVLPLKHVAAQNAQNERERQLEAAGGVRGAGLTATDPRWIIANIINVLLSVAGAILFCFMFYAGYLWLTAAGNEEQVEHAKTIIKSTIIGLLIVLISLSLTQFIIFYAKWSTSGQTTYQGQLPPGSPYYGR